MNMYSSYKSPQSPSITYGYGPRYSAESVMSSASNGSVGYPSSTRPTTTMGSGYTGTSSSKIEHRRVPDKPMTCKAYIFNTGCQPHADLRIASDRDHVKSIHRKKVSVHLQEKVSYDENAPTSRDAQPSDYHKSSKSKSNSKSKR